MSRGEGGWLRARASPATALRAHWAALAADPAARRYGVGLAALHLLVFVHWSVATPAHLLISNASAPVCWPFFEACARLRVLPPALARVPLLLQALCAIAAGLAFLSARHPRLGGPLLAAATAIYWTVLAQDFRLRMNQHLMLSWVCAVFLLLPARRRALPVLLVAFYVWAGALKLDADWLSGASLRGRRPWLLPEALLPASLWYVAALELVIAPLLLARRPWLRWAALGQLALFHVVSWGVVGFFYPLLSLGLLAYFPITWRAPAEAGAGATPTLSELARGRAGAAAYGTLALFSLAQLPPLLFPGDPALTGQGRLFALHMFDAPVDCEATVTLRERDGTARTLRLDAPLPARIACDPIVHLGFARALCEREQTRPDFADLDLRLRSRRTSWSAGRFVDVVAQAGVCTRPPRYRLWRPNSWIRGE